MHFFIINYKNNCFLLEDFVMQEPFIFSGTKMVEVRLLSCLLPQELLRMQMTLP